MSIIAAASSRRTANRRRRGRNFPWILAASRDARVGTEALQNPASRRSGHVNAEFGLLHRGIQVAPPVPLMLGQRSAWIRGLRLYDSGRDGAMARLPNDERCRVLERRSSEELPEPVEARPKRFTAVARVAETVIAAGDHDDTAGLAGPAVKADPVLQRRPRSASARSCRPRGRSTRRTRGNRTAPARAPRAETRRP